MTGGAPAAARVDRLLRDHADWAPYVAVLREVVRAIGEDPPGGAGAGGPPLARSTTAIRSEGRPAPAPLLAGAVIEVDARAFDKWVRRLLRVASEHGGAALLGDAPRARALDALALVEAAIDHDAERLASLADALGVDASALGAVAHLAAAPLLHQARRAHEAAVPPYWAPGYCPVCGAFPALAETRGLERAHRLRCVRCAADWWTEWLRCVHCGNRDHLTLGSLVPDGGVESRRAETCEQCRAYVKLLTTLAAIPAAELALEDLATVDLDVAAFARGYRRPESSGLRLDARVVAADRPPRPKLIDHLGGLFRA